MKPSTLATVLIRLAALYIIIKGVFLIVGAIGGPAFTHLLTHQHGPPSTISEDATDYNTPAPPVDGVNTIHLLCAGLIICGGVLLCMFSKCIGSLIGRDLEQTAQPWIPTELKEWQEEAQKDIKNHVFRIYCMDWPEDKPLFDDVTGFPMELIDAPDTAEVRVGIAAYNAVMRNWFVTSQAS